MNKDWMRKGEKDAIAPPPSQQLCWPTTDVFVTVKGAPKFFATSISVGNQKKILYLLHVLYASGGFRNTKMKTNL
jgi:hypothetical protein